MSNAELIEQTASLLVTVAYAHQEFDNYDHVLHHGNVKKLTEALELADKRIAELERKLGVAREALKKTEHTHECKARRSKEGDEWIDETKCDCCIGEALEQIGGDDAGT